MSWSGFMRRVSDYAIDSLSKSDNPHIANAVALAFDRPMNASSRAHNQNEERSDRPDKPAASTTQRLPDIDISQSNNDSKSSLPVVGSSTQDTIENDATSDLLRPPISIWGSRCFRSTSTLSLDSAESRENARRRLLLVYIHGFMGAEASFQEFPAHVHNLVTTALAESHVVYSKVYPRYKSRRAIDIACEDFCKWLAPHEAEDLDVILLGHSLGGILAAEIAIALSAGDGTLNPRRNCILGLINFDVPFLGMHPGVVSAGLASLFRRNKQDPGSVLEEPALVASENASDDDTISESLAQMGDGALDPLFGVPKHDPNFEPAFENDVHLIQRDRLHGALHFIGKNSENLPRAVKAHVKSYFEFGGCLANYHELQRRYQKILDLEAVDEYGTLDNNREYFAADSTHIPSPRRLRFVNYYTSSTGFPKAKSPVPSPERSRENTPSISEEEPKPSTTLAEPSKGKPPLRSKKARERKFCRVPAGDTNELGDSLWVRIHMEDVDEVVAHQSMFFPKGAYYEKLVGDTATRIERWIQDEMTRRVIVNEQLETNTGSRSHVGEFDDVSGQENGVMINLVDCEALEEELHDV